MNPDKEQDDEIDKIKVFSSEDEKLKILGELLSNKSSRDIIKLLMNKECYTNEIAKKLDMRVSLVIHHLKKLRELGLLEVKNKKIVKKGNEHRYYRVAPNLFVVANQTNEEIQEKGMLRKIFREGTKIFVIGIAVISSWFSSTFNQTSQISKIPPNSDIKLDKSIYSINETSNIISQNISEINYSFILIPIIIISCSIFLIWFSKKYK